jgi:hypothetical protein
MIGKLIIQMKNNMSERNDTREERAKAYFMNNEPNKKEQPK